ncbi:unnamed protein product [Phyllotreta striolata]|uniref:SAM-dependent MTase RsmB/NOP-type domain-containing protein n=1 Tax=Phyllotreta striolata TaxID=444603 RepID=A0A9N9TN36_PHYSR|nr:unnamed protein product [Phyllotreta striolata]
MEKQGRQFPVCPRIYKVAASAAKEVSERMGSIKSIVLGKKNKHPNVKGMFALVSKLYQKSDEIDMLLKRSQLLEQQAGLNPWLAKILLVELLWGKKRLPGQSRPETTIQAYEQIFKAHLSDTALEDPLSNNAHVGKPRYVRINTLKWNQNDAIDTFRDEGWALNKFLDKTDYNGFLEKIVTLNEQEFMVDIHIPNLLVFPSKTTFYNHEAYKNGSMVLQDKASCFPVHVLNPPPGSIVLDMCAAPGMKTSHLAAVMNNTGTIYATERDPLRYETLLTILDNAGATCVKALNRDVLTCNDKDFPNVEYILVDPSCSGTGITEVPVANQITKERVNNLSGFQIKILRHALTKFPKAKRVIYSTCSVLPEENEDVVRQVLETNFNFKLLPAKQYIGDSWFNTGSEDYGDIGRYCLYAKPNEDHTNGFFVAVFERLQEGETNQFFDTKVFNYKKHVQIKQKEIRKEAKREKRRQYAADFDEMNLGENTISHDTEKKKKYKTEKTSSTRPEKVKKEKIPNEGNEIVDQDTKLECVDDTSEKIKKKKKKNKSKHNEFKGDEEINIDCVNNISEEPEKKKKKHKSKTIDTSSNTPLEEEIVIEPLNEKKAKKKKSKYNLQEVDDESSGKRRKLEEMASCDVNSAPEKTKKKSKSKRVEVNIENNMDNLVSKKRKKKKHEESEIIHCE